MTRHNKARLYNGIDDKNSSCASLSMRSILYRLIAAVFCFVSATELSATTFIRQPAGLIKGARLSWVSGSVIKIGVGYGEDTGEYWEIAPTDQYNTSGFALSGLATSTHGVMQYIYIDKANSVFPAVTLTNSTVAPVWSDTYLGWYNGDNRCIGAVWVKADGTLNQFFCPDDETYVGDFGIVLNTPAISTAYGVWTMFDVGPYCAVNAREVLLGGTTNWNGSYSWDYCKSGIRAIGALPLYEDGSHTASCVGWIGFPRGDHRCEWLSYAQTTAGTFNINVRGYRLER